MIPNQTFGSISPTVVIKENFFLSFQESGADGNERKTVFKSQRDSRGFWSILNLQPTDQEVLGPDVKENWRQFQSWGVWRMPGQSMI